MDGTILVGRLDGITEHYSAIINGEDQGQIFEADECAPCAFLSPDGERIMWPVFRDDGRLSTTTVAADGTDEVVIPLPAADTNLVPGAWSPDGMSVALAGWNDEHPSLGGIYTARAVDGSHVTQITEANDEFQEPFAWSPDGERLLVFVETGPFGAVTHAGDLFVVSADGSDLQRLNPPGVVVGRVTAVGWPATWSPDGQHVAFAGFDAEALDGQSAVFVIGVDGSDARRITGWGSYIAAAQWSPTGEWIAFSSVDGSTVSIVAPEGGDLRTLPGESACCPVWSPTGTQLLVQRGEPGARDLWVIDVEGEVVGQVTRSPGEYFGYAWADST